MCGDFVEAFSGKQQSVKSLEGKDGIGFYKGNTVFIKKLRKQISEERSPFCKELVQVNTPFHSAKYLR